MVKCRKPIIFVCLGNITVKKSVIIIVVDYKSRHFPQAKSAGGGGGGGGAAMEATFFRLLTVSSLLLLSIAVFFPLGCGEYTCGFLAFML